MVFETEDEIRQILQSKYQGDARQKLLLYLCDLVDYWSSDSVTLNMSTRERVRGVIFSTLAAIDGCSIEIPPFAMKPIFEDGSEGEDIGSGLHEEFSGMCRRDGWDSKTL